MDSLYRDILLDHYNNSRSRGQLADADFACEAKNSSCGDLVVLYGHIRENILADVSFTGTGCVISQAAASLLCEQLKGKKTSVVRQFDQEALKTLIGMNLGPVRLKCALLPLSALQDGIAQYQAQGVSNA